MAGGRYPWLDCPMVRLLSRGELSNFVEPSWRRTTNRRYSSELSRSLRSLSQPGLGFLLLFSLGCGTGRAVYIPLLDLHAEYMVSIYIMCED